MVWEASDPADGYNYDFLDTLSNVTSDGDSICIIQDNMYTSNGSSKALSWSPTGHYSTGSGGSQTVSVNANAGGVGLGYSSTYNASAGYLQGDISPPSNGNGPTFDGSWSYGDDTNPANQPSSCDYRADAVEAAIGYRTPSTDSEYHLLFAPVVYYQKNT